MDENPLMQLVVIAPTGCYSPSCNYREKVPYEIKIEEIRITSIKADEKGWLAKGKGNAIVRRHCPMCHQIYEAILHEVPILCESFTCPNCGKSETLHYRINSIEADKEAFEFEVVIECKTCSKKRSLKKMIKGLLEIVKLEVGPLGISVKKA
jgi:hypothetical protein